MEIAQAYLRGDAPDRAPVDVVLTIPRAAVVEVTDTVGVFGNAAVSSETARRLCCDAGVVEVEEGEHGNPLPVGRKWRTLAGAAGLFRAGDSAESRCEVLRNGEEDASSTMN